MSLSHPLSESALLLTIGWAVLLTATLGLAAACLGYVSRLLWPRLLASRRHTLVVLLFIASIVTAVALVLAENRDVTAPTLQDRPLIEVHTKISPVPRGGARLDTFTTRAAGVDRLVSPVMLGASVRSLALVWAFMTVLLAGRLIAGLWWVGRIRRRAAPMTSKDAADIAGRLAIRLDVRAPIELLESTEVDTPVTAGWSRPFVLFPVGMASALGDPGLDLVLAHELAHVHRHDFAIGLLHAGADVITGLSPGHRWLSSDARRLREEACDDLVVALGVEATSYAHALERLARMIAGNRTVTSAVCAADRYVAQRIRHLLGAVSRPTRARVIGVVALLGIASLATVVLTAAAGVPVQWTESDPAGGQSQPSTKSLIPHGYYPHVTGSPVRISDVRPGSQFLFDAISVTNVFPKRIVQLGFWADIVPTRTPFDTAICCLTSKVVPVELDPGQSAMVPVQFISAADLRGFQASVGPSLLAMLSPSFATFEDGTSWVGGAPPAEPLASIPRFLLSTAAPAGSPGKNIPFCYDAEEKETSEGGIYPIQGELGHFARCTNGRWVETDIGIPAGVTAQGRAHVAR